MNRVIVKSVHGALTDTYAMVSIQYSHTGGVGVKFAEHFYSRDPLPPQISLLYNSYEIQSTV